MIPRYTLRCEHGKNDTTEVTFEAAALDTILARMADFLRGAGFYFDGELDVVPPPSDSTVADEADGE